MKLTKKDLRKIEINDILREAREVKKKNNFEKLSELRVRLSKITTEASLRGFDSYLSSL